MRKTVSQSREKKNRLRDEEGISDMGRFLRYYGRVEVLEASVNVKSV